MATPPPIPKDARKDYSITQIVRCARCGKGHLLKFDRLGNSITFPDGSNITHWALCPETGEPILMEIRPSVR